MDYISPTEAEYAEEVRSHSNWLNWIFGIFTFSTALACLQFANPSKVAIVSLVMVLPMYVFAFTNLPVTLRTLRKRRNALPNEHPRRKRLEVLIAYLEKKYHGPRVVAENAVLWIALLCYVFVIASGIPGLEWVLWIRSPFWF
jgi:hypothetical protein